MSDRWRTPLIVSACVVGMIFCMFVFSPAIWVRDAAAHGSQSLVRTVTVLPTTCQDSELIILLQPGPVLYVSDPASCSGVAVWEVATMDEVVDEWAVYVSSYFDQRVKLTITGGATNTLVIEEAVVNNNELRLNLLGVRMSISSPASIDLSSIEASGNPVDDALPFDYAVWIEETGGPGACAEGSLDCAVLAGTRNAITAVERAANALIALPVVQTPATVATDGPLLLDPFFHSFSLSAGNVQDVAKAGDGLNPETAVTLGGDGTTFLTVNEIAWGSVHGLQVVSAFDMSTGPGYILDSLADTSGQEPFDEVNSMADITEQADGTVFGTTDFFHLIVFQGVYEIAGVSYSRVFLNPPTCTYAANQLADALIDLNSCSNFTKPGLFKNIELIGRVLVKNDTDLINSIDTPSAAVVSVLAGTANLAPYPPLMMRISRITDQSLLAGIDEFIVWESETFDDDDWFPGADNEHIEFGFTGRVVCTLSLRADVDPAGAPKELCLRTYIDDVLPPAVEYACFLTSDDMDASAVAHEVFEVAPGFDLSFEVLGTADLDMRAVLNCERKR